MSSPATPTAPGGELQSEAEPRGHDYAASGQIIIAALQIFIAPWVLVWLIAGSSRTARDATGVAAVATTGAAVVLASQDQVIGARALLTVACGVLAMALDHRPNNQHPSMLVSLPTAQLMSIGMYVWIMDTYPGEFPPLWSLCTAATLETAQWMILGALLAYEAGRWLAWSTGATSSVASSFRRAMDDLARSEYALQAMIVVGLAIFGLILSIRGVGYLAPLLPTSVAGLLGNMEFLYYVAIYAAIAAAIRRQRNVAFVIGWCLLALAYELISGSKGRFAGYILLPAAFVYVVTRKRTHYVATSLLVTLGLVSWLVVYPTLIEYRLLLEQDADSDPVAAMATANARSTDSYYDKVMTPLVGSVLAEQSLAITSAIEFDVRTSAEELPQRLFLFWIPRFLWPGKPMMLDSNWIGRESRRLSQSNTTTAVVTTSVAEQYVYLGPWGVLLTALVGFVTAVLFCGVRFNTRATDIEIGLTTYMSRTLPGLIASSFEGAFTGVLLHVLVLFVFVVVARATAPTSRRRTHAT
ncbi:MAG: hypothetical protein K1X94_01380 [Sandaracinaceae bacterium]|nr:hypothetical protein [Sandaracinaceae bacterium]